MNARVRVEEDAGADEVEGRDGVDAAGETKVEVGADADADADVEVEDRRAGAGAGTGE